MNKNSKVDVPVIVMILIIVKLDYGLNKVPKNILKLIFDDKTHLRLAFYSIKRSLN